MTRWAPQKQDILSGLADEILHNYGRGRGIVAVDGVDGAGKTRFADALADALAAAGHAVFRASVDGFHRPRVERYARGRDSAEGFYADSYDYAKLQSLLVEPFRRRDNPPFVTAAFDLVSDAPVAAEEVTGPPDAILVIDGIFLGRPELKGLWNYAIWLDVPAEVAEARLRERDGEGGTGERYTGGQAIYLAAANPRLAANAIIDNTDYDHPRRVFTDSC